MDLRGRTPGWPSRLAAALWRRARAWPKTSSAIVALLLLVSLLKATAAWADRELAQRVDDAYSRTPKQWIPRGLYGDGVSENSPAAVRAAFARGALGVEIDMHYDPDRDLFVVAHNHPTRDAQGRRVYSRVDGNEVHLDELMRASAAGHYFWYDFKNLGHLDARQTERAIDRLDAIAAIHGVKDRAYIEGSDPLRLRRWKRAGFRTILAIPIEAERWPGSSLLIDASKIALWLGGYDGLALGYGELDAPKLGRATRRALRHVPLFVFHVPPDRALVAELVALPQVRVLLVGRDVSVDLLDLEGLPAAPREEPSSAQDAHGAETTTAVQGSRPGAVGEDRRQGRRRNGRWREGGQADIRASNGILHVIDSVILPN